MSQIHRVVILNKPLKIRGYTLLQWALMVIAAAGCFIIGTQVPKEWKLANIPVGFWVGISIFSGVLVFIHASQMKPFTWWKNVVLYRLKMVPTVYMPRYQPGRVYPDPTIQEIRKREDRPYVS